MSTSPPLELSDAIDADLSEPFCSYCGQAPTGVWREQPHRTCRRCGFGVMLWVPAAAAPRREPFLVVDQELVVQAISRYAEAVLTVDEPAAVAAPLGEFLVSGDDGNETSELARMVRLAATGTPSTDSLPMRTAHESPATFSVRVTSCGPPLAAMVILAPRVTTGAAPKARRSRPRAADRAGRRPSGSGEGAGERTASAGERAAPAGVAAARTGEPATAEETLTRLAGLLIVSGQRLAAARSDIEAGLGAIAGLREELEQAERELVELARRSGLSWAQIGTELNIIGRRGV